MRRVFGFFVSFFALAACSPEGADAPGALKVTKAAFAKAHSGEQRAYALPGSEVIPLTSEINGVEYALYVKLPRGYETSTEEYPLLVTLDADYQFAVAANHVEHLSARGQAPEMIIVSIGYAYDPEDTDAYRLNRTRDYTPAHTLEGGYGPDYQKVSGGGPAFADVIAGEILPLIEERYRVDKSERLYVGHSYGGLFGAWLLLERPELFNRYILVSPSLWYNDKMMLAAARQAKPFARKTHVYMGVGSWEEQPERSYAMVSDLTAFAGLLAAHDDPNLIFETRVFDDETHASIYPAVLSTGVRHLFLVMDQE
ncbi:alpha/beta hydrolase [Hyphococcus sp.]|uniref:alpha/beta hydrolase n=1 Tax=Hyphococcus sp. TaxID=2038636 RepID=UPI0035C68439